jgi:hypothetical protein
MNTITPNQTASASQAIADIATQSTPGQPCTDERFIDLVTSGLSTDIIDWSAEADESDSPTREEIWAEFELALPGTEFPRVHLGNGQTDSVQSIVREALAIALRNRQYFAAIQPEGPAFGVGFSEEAAMRDAEKCLSHEGETTDGIKVIEITRESYNEIKSGNPSAIEEVA